MSVKQGDHTIVSRQTIGAEINYEGFEYTFPTL